MLHKKTIFSFLILGVFLLVAVFLFLRNSWSSEIKNNNKPKVTASIFPIYDIVKNVAGEKIDVELILPPGASPHTYEPKPSDIKKIQNSSAVFIAGHGLDLWVSNIIKDGNSVTIIPIDKNVTLKSYEEFEKINAVKSDNHTEETHHNEHEETDINHSHEGVDPHYYLSIKNGQLIAKQISSELQILFPEFKNEILKNEKQYLTELKKIEEEINSKISKVQGKRIATFHNAWNYFAEELGVKVVATFEEYPGEEPTALYLKNFSEKIKDNKLKVVFTEPQFSTKAILPIAKDLGVTIIEIDPIGGLPERDSFIKLMKYNVLEIEKALSNQ